VRSDLSLDHSAYLSHLITATTLFQRVKSNKKDCRRLAKRSAEIVHDILRQTKDYGEHLPLEAQHNITQIEQIFHDINGFMRQLRSQMFMKRYARQLENKDEIMKYENLLDEALIMFGVNLQISIHRRLTMLQRETSERHGEVLDVSRMTDSERELLTKILAKDCTAQFRHAFFFTPKVPLCPYMGTTITDCGEGRDCS